jgi:hypothetical protein
MPRAWRPVAPSTPVARSCRPSGGTLPGSSSSPDCYAGLKATNEKTKIGSGSLINQSNRRKAERGDSPSTCFLSKSRALRASSDACRRLRTVASCSSREWRRSSYEMLSWFSTSSSHETSSSRYLRVACAPSSAARSCWSRSWASSHARRSRSRAARASARAARSC